MITSLTPLLPIILTQQHHLKKVEKALSPTLNTANNADAEPQSNATHQAPPFASQPLPSPSPAESEP